MVATGIPLAVNLALDPRGGLWVVTAAFGPSTPGGLWYVPPGGHSRRVATGLTEPTAVSWVGPHLYVADVAGTDVGRITVFDGFNGTSFATRRVLLGHVPIGSHTIGSIVPATGGRLFTGLGAQEDHSGPPGHVVSFTPSGGPLVPAATGLRTAFGLAFWGNHLLVTDNGPDHAAGGSDALYAFSPGGAMVDFGFPKCYGQGGSACAGYPAPVARFPAHSSPEGVAVKGDVAFIAGNGSSILPHPTASEILRVDLRTGGQGVFWRAPHVQDLVGLAIGPDGDLYATLLTSGRVVRFSI